MPVSGVAAQDPRCRGRAVINQAVTDRRRGSGYDVVQTWDGPGAVAQFADTAPDLVLLDVMLPGFDGHEVCRRIQAGRTGPGDDDWLEWNLGRQRAEALLRLRRADGDASDAACARAAAD